MPAAPISSNRSSVGCPSSVHKRLLAWRRATSRPGMVAWVAFRLDSREMDADVAGLSFPGLDLTEFKRALLDFDIAAGVFESKLGRAEINIGGRYIGNQRNEYRPIALHRRFEACIRRFDRAAKTAPDVQLPVDRGAELPVVERRIKARCADPLLEQVTACIPQGAQTLGKPMRAVASEDGPPLFSLTWFQE